MNVLCIGDVVGNAGLECFEALLAPLKRHCAADAVVVNGENAANTGVGINKASLERLLLAGADVVTTGNHAFRGADYELLFNENARLLRPLNFQSGVAGHGSYVLDLGKTRLLVANLIGQSFMGFSTANPYDALDALLAAAETPNIVVDFHAESTSEKKAFAMHYAGRISALVGTHTHVQTADEQVLFGKTGYITDAGMTGPTESVIGVKHEDAVQKQRFGVPVRFRVAGGPSELCGVLFDIDESTGICRRAERIAVQ